MTADELLKLFNTTFEYNKWPESYEVDAETYGNICNTLLKYLYKDSPIEGVVVVFIGPNCGILFKNVELILKHGQA